MRWQIVELTLTGDGKQKVRSYPYFFWFPKLSFAYMSCIIGVKYLWNAVLTYIQLFEDIFKLIKYISKYLKIFSYELKISSNDLKISSNDLKISLIHLKISSNIWRYLQIIEYMLKQRSINISTAKMWAESLNLQVWINMIEYDATSL